MSVSASLKFIPVPLPKTTGAPAGDAAKLELAFQEWARQVVLAFQKPILSVTETTASTATAAATSSSSTAAQLAAANANAPTAAATPTGPAGGDLAGTYPNPSVQRVDGKTLGDAAFQSVASILAALSAISAGAAGGDLTGNYPNPVVNLLSALTSMVRKPVGYATTGNVQVSFSAGSFADISLTGAISFSPAGSTGMAAGASQELVLRNTSGGALGITWPGSWIVAGAALPTSLSNNSAVRILLTCFGTTEASIVATFIAAGNSGTVTSVGTGTGLTGGPITGAGTIAIANSGVTAGDYTGSKLSINAQGQVTAAARNKRIYVDDYADIQTAFTAACGVNGCLFLPPGITDLPSGGLVLPAGFTGAVSIIGCGKNVSILRQSNASAGINFVVNTGSSGQTAFVLRGFSLIANNAGATKAISIDFGTGSLVSGFCSFDDLHFDGTGWSSSFMYLRGVWTSTYSNITGNGTGTAGGDGLVFDSCVNANVTNVCIQNIGKGIYLPTGTAAVGDSQGVNCDNIRFVTALYGVYAELGLNCGIWLNNFMIDNGSASIAVGNIPIYLHGAVNHNESALTNGQILQGAGTYAMVLDAVQNVMIQNVGFTFCNNSTAAIHLTGNTADCSVQACTAPAAGSPKLIVADAGTTGSKAYNNLTGASFTDGGTNSLVS